MSRWNPLRTLLWGVLAVLGGCGPDEDFPLPPVVWEGDTVRVRMDDPGIEVCGGSFEALDRHAVLVREALRLEGDGMIEYSIGDQSFVDAACDRTTSIACTKGDSGRVFTETPMHEHELVHALRILDPTIQLRSSPFEEGLASVFGGDGFSDVDPGFDPSVILIDDRTLRGAKEYHHAGQTVALLLQEHGVEAFRQFDMLARSMGEDDAFVAAFGESKEQFAADASLAPHCEKSQWWSPLLECDGDVIVADPTMDRLVLSGNLDCGGEDVRGPRGGRIWMSQRFLLDRRTSTLEYELEMPEDATLEIVACNGGCPERFAYIGARDDVGSVLNGLRELEPGEYFLRMSRPATDGDGYFEVGLH